MIFGPLWKEAIHKMGRQALFTDLIFNEEGEPAQLADIGGVPHYAVPDGDFLRHVEAEYVDRQVVEALKERILPMKDAIIEGVVKMMGQEDLFTRPAIESAIENMEFIGGPRGFVGMKRVMNNMGDVFDAPWLLIWTFIGVIVTILIIRNFMSSTFGKGVEAIREDEIASELMSVNTRRIKVIAFMLSCGLAGLAGGLFAHWPGGYVNPGTFTILKSTEVMVMVYLGGMGSISGSIISAIGFTLLLEVLRPLGTYKWVVIPLLLVVMMLFRPSGILGNKELTDVFPRLRAIFGSEEESYALASD